MDPLLHQHVSFWWALGLGLMLMTGELLVPATVFLWTGVACLGVAIPLAIFPDFEMVWALLLWFALSVAAVLAARLYHRNHSGAQDQLRPDGPPNRYGSDFVGMTATLNSDSHEGQARVDLKGANWGVKLPAGDLKAGARVKITAVDGIYLVASPVE
jgi:membrane protein implicated in regulation of membrane protease activity